MNRGMEITAADGLRDALPPDAAHDARSSTASHAGCRARGYERFDPPLVEFEDSLFTAPVRMSLWPFPADGPREPAYDGGSRRHDHAGRAYRRHPSQGAPAVAAGLCRPGPAGPRGPSTARNGSSMKFKSNCSARNKRKPISKLSRWPRTR